MFAKLPPRGPPKDPTPPEPEFPPRPANAASMARPDPDCWSGGISRAADRYREGRRRATANANKKPYTATRHRKRRSAQRSMAHATRLGGEKLGLRHSLAARSFSAGDRVQTTDSGSWFFKLGLC